MSGIAITVLVRNPASTARGHIKFYDIGPRLTADEKLKSIRELGSLSGIQKARGWKEILPDEHGDWLNQRDQSFDAFVALGSKEGKNSAAIFRTFSLGVVTNRDAWCVNSSAGDLTLNIQRMIGTYESELERFTALG